MGMTREEFTRAANEYSRVMFRAARAVLDSDADAEDAVSQALLLAWQARHRLRDPAAARAWLVKITVNCARRMWRRQSRTLPLDEAERLPAPEADRRYRELWDAVLTLPPEQRAVVVLFYYEDMTVEQTARLLGIPPGTAKSRLNRARERLKQTLCEEDEP